MELDERGDEARVDARFIVNAGGPFVAGIDAMSSVAPPPRALKARARQPYRAEDAGPRGADAYTLQDNEDRVVFVLPWLDRRFPHRRHDRNPGARRPGSRGMLRQEQAYLLDAYNRYFGGADGPATECRCGVDLVRRPRPARRRRQAEPRDPAPALATVANGTGGFVTLYGGKLTTHRAFAEDVLDDAS